MDKQVTYDNEAEIGYIYLAEPYKYKISNTDELPKNNDIMLDFGNDLPIIGIELAGDTAIKVKHLVDTVHIFKKAITADHELFYSFRLNDKSAKQSVTHPDTAKIVFLFSNADCLDFIGIDIYDTKSYDESFLIGR
ncbi:DUF2283 domain-containing protein [Peribacillus butanolivorans]|uniref:DUF2283 domain-containing protein n=1 Tax=Peribacillus butanolivorans TaxID=421767 RepID=UPI00167F79E6|nr:DUF2283 domain-containing protein [Peribacillus butanolivorans]QNU03167.1 DUF2283 domain-containing protein [Peribacillus butanolivorans]